ncbi:hypothetical protein BLNAU_6828 [Blattamonas nauphoetae]|uniref:Uncharacterized protein n=1 Tax=Blattamonas nauphoetae TaxID=2049346 RepID=A0ABQ9Y318_9EUKA|nr:hypothetical protein BLNAU_6828 [Blattamonas nauphoetae]
MGTTSGRVRWNTKYALSAFDETRAKFHRSTPFSNIVGERAMIKQTEYAVSESTAMEDKEKAVPTEQTGSEERVRKGGGEVRRAHDECGMLEISNVDEHDERNSSSCSIPPFGENPEESIHLFGSHHLSTQFGERRMVRCGHSVVHRFEREKDGGVVVVDEAAFWFFRRSENLHRAESIRVDCSFQQALQQHSLAVRHRLACDAHAGFFAMPEPLASPVLHKSQHDLPSSPIAQILKNHIPAPFPKTAV